MSDVEIELKAWLSPPKWSGASDDVSDLASIARDLLEPRERLLERADARVMEAMNLTSQINGRLQPLALTLGTVLRTNAKVSVDPTIQRLFAFPKELGSPDIELTAGSCIHFASPGPHGVDLWTGYGLELLGDGTVYLTAAHVIKRSPGRIQIVGNKVFRKRVPFCSAQQDGAIEELIELLSEQLRPAIQAFLDQLKSISD